MAQTICLEGKRRRAVLGLDERWRPSLRESFLRQQLDLVRHLGYVDRKTCLR